MTVHCMSQELGARENNRTMTAFLKWMKVEFLKSSSKDMFIDLRDGREERERECQCLRLINGLL